MFILVNVFEARLSYVVVEGVQLFLVFKMFSSICENIKKLLYKK